MAITQVISSLPEVANRRDADFIETADTFLDTLPNFSVEMNNYATQANDLMDTVVINIDSINAVNDNMTKIDSVADNITNVNNVGDNIDNVNTTAGSIANVNTTASNISSINTTAGSIDNVNTVADDLNADTSNISVVASNISSVNTTAGSIDNVNTTAGSIDNVNTTASNISDVNTVADDLNADTSNIVVVSTNITNVNNVGGNIDNVNTTAGSIDNVNTVADDLNADTSNITITATNIDNVNNVGGSISNVNTVADNISDVTTIADDLNADTSNIVVVADNISNVNNVGGSIDNVNTTATNISDVTTVADDLNADTSNISLVADNITNVNNTGGSIDNVNTVANSIDNVNTTATNISDVTTVADDLNADTSNISVVAGSIDNVNTTAGSIDNVNTTASNISDVTTVADDLNATTSNITTTATNIDNVNNVGGSIDNVNTVASNISNVNTTASNITDINTLADKMYAVDFMYNVYLGSHEDDPTERSDGSDLQVGDLYYNSTYDEVRFYTTNSDWSVRLDIADAYTQAEADDTFLNKKSGVTQKLSSNVEILGDVKSFNPTIIDVSYNNYIDKGKLSLPKNNKLVLTSFRDKWNEENIVSLEANSDNLFIGFIDNTSLVLFDGVTGDILHNWNDSDGIATSSTKYETTSGEQVYAVSYNQWFYVNDVGHSKVYKLNSQSPYDVEELTNDDSYGMDIAISGSNLYILSGAKLFKYDINEDGTLANETSIDKPTGAKNMVIMNDLIYLQASPTDDNYYYYTVDLDLGNLATYDLKGLLPEEYIGYCLIALSNKLLVFGYDSDGNIPNGYYTIDESFNVEYVNSIITNNVDIESTNYILVKQRYLRNGIFGLLLETKLKNTNVFDSSVADTNIYIINLYDGNLNIINSVLFDASDSVLLNRHYEARQDIPISIQDISAGGIVFNTDASIGFNTTSYTLFSVFTIYPNRYDVNWQSEAIYTINSSKLLAQAPKVTLLADSTAGSFYIYLPPFVEDGMIVRVIDSTSSFDINNVIVRKINGTIQDLDDELVLDVKNTDVKLVYNNGNWRVVI